MGSIYRQKQSKFWWIKYYRNGRPYRESTGSDRESDARRLLRLREGDIERGVAIAPRVGRITVEEAAADLLNDYRVNGKRSLPDLERRLRKHVLLHFGGQRLATITPIDMRTFIAQRQAAGASNGEINRELTHLRRMFSLAIQSGKLLHAPYIPRLREAAPRTGFFEREQFEAVRAHLPEEYQHLVTFAYVTGWRAGEITSLQWSQVDFIGRCVRLNPGTTKNEEGRVFPFTAVLEPALVSQRERTRTLQRTGVITPWVFHRDDGSRIQSFYKAWRTLPAKIAETLFSWKMSVEGGEVSGL
jgi:integrase